MRIDLHTHSDVSDGTDSPTTVMEKAAAAGLDVVAITDHETLAGWDEAATAADRVGLRLVRGVEVSTYDRRQDAHLLGYEPDPTDAPMLEMFAGLQASRADRVTPLLERLRELGIPVERADLDRITGSASPSKQHVADALIGAGHVRDNDEAFARYLHDEGPADVPRWKPTLEEAVTTLVRAGAAPVFAHPWGRGGERDEARFAELADLGLVGIEVDHQDHSPNARDALRAIARNLGLVITGSSDYHGTRKTGYDLGCNTTDPEQFAALMAATRAGAAGT